ncbi:nicolin-1 isoform X1 [Ornithorhynchus anatinus]|uniref:Nicolin 1, tubulin polyglutamylase complex subunit n=1 Tax=Ornithorhynchus anatinus TaxID=9258 RepID=A0A6I8P1P2_ORNAN|nr:nicolin-1 isoform X1 [Ornithorhynchus anatinus]
MARLPVLCHVKGAVALQVGDVKTEQGRPGVVVLDVTFPHAGPVNLQEITFKNYYTAFLSVRVLKRGSLSHCPPKWFTCLRDYSLMPNPHTEEGAQDYISVFKHQMLCNVDKVLELRLILRQPSPLWLTFTLDDLRIYQRGQQSPRVSFPAWLSHPVAFEKTAFLPEQDLPDPNKVSSEVQQMWVLTEMIRANHSVARIGRFDVDGCYDLNLLSYT